MKTSWLRSLIRNYGDVGIVLAGTCLLLRPLWLRKFVALGVLGAALILVLAPRSRRPHPYQRPMHKNAPVPQPTYTVTDLGVLPGDTQSGAISLNDQGQVVCNSYIPHKSGHAFLWQNGRLRALCDSASRACGINAKDQVVGEAFTKDGRVFAFLWQNGRMRDLGTLPDGGRATARGINDKGQVVGGVCAVGKRGARAFLWQNGRMRNLGTLPGGRFSQGRAINENGQVVGYAHNGEYWGNYMIWHAFLWDPAKGMQDLGTLGRDSSARAINDRGQVVGESATTTPEGDQGRAFLYSERRMRDLGVLPGYYHSAAYGINNRGQIVGKLSKPGQDHACLWTDGRLVNLNDLIPPDSGWELIHAFDINDSGQIVGSGLLNGHYRGYLLTPSRR